MVKFYTEIPPFLFPWIQEQKMFWVATAPLSASGHVNVSPKGYEGTFHVIDEKRVWYEDLTGSGIETIAHLKENGRMTIMLTAFNGPPRIVRLFGIGTVHEFGSPEYEALIPMENRHIGSRAAIVLDLHKVSSLMDYQSCGYAVPLFDFKAHRTGLNDITVRREREDIMAESCAISTSPSSNTSVVRTSFADKTNILSEVQTNSPAVKGLKRYWRDQNCKSIDGLPGVTSGFNATQPFSPNARKAEAGVRPKDIERVEPASVQVRSLFSGLVPGWEQEKHSVVVGFVLGALAMIVAERGISVLAGIQWS